MKKLVSDNMLNEEDRGNKSSNKMEILCCMIMFLIGIDFFKVYRNILKYPDYKYKTNKKYICKNHP